LHPAPGSAMNPVVAERLDSFESPRSFVVSSGQLSSVVEQRFRKAWVLGSIPRAGSIFPDFLRGSLAR
jgi:hypothetical protein